MCGACYDVCPVKIDIPSILVHLRSVQVEAKREQGGLPTPEAVAMAAAAWAMTDAGRWSRAQRSSRAARVLGRRRDKAQGLIRSLPGPFAAWTGVRDVPRPPAETFREWWARERSGDGEHR